jgi:hypothetical protein
VLILVVTAVATLVSAMLRRTGGAVPQAEGYGPLVPASACGSGSRWCQGRPGRRSRRLLPSRPDGRRFDVVYQQLGWDEPLEQVSALETGQQARTLLATARTTAPE